MNVAKNAVENGILGRAVVGIWCQKPQISPQMFSLFVFFFFPLFVFFPFLLLYWTFSWVQQLPRVLSVN